MSMLWKAQINHIYRLLKLKWVRDSLFVFNFPPKDGTLCVCGDREHLNIILNTSNILFPIVTQHLILVLGSNRKKAVSAGWWIKLVSPVWTVLVGTDSSQYRWDQHQQSTSLTSGVFFQIKVSLRNCFKWLIISQSWLSDMNFQSFLFVCSR